MSLKKIRMDPKTCTNPICPHSNPQPLPNFNKDSTKYDGLNPRCRPCQRAQCLLSHHKHKEIRNAASRKWNKEHRDNINANLNHKRKENPMFRVAENIRRAVNGCIEYNGFKKTAKLYEYLGCNSQEFKAHLESLFQPGMTWDNYGFGMDKWNIDHKTPLASAETIEDLYKLNHFSNLQPMWQPENIAKSDKMPNEINNSEFSSESILKCQS